MMTRWPAARSALAVWLPMYPAPPVTRTVLAANGVIREAVPLHLVRREQVAAVEDNRRSHQFAHAGEIGAAELVPLRDDCQRVSALHRVVAVRDVLNLRPEKTPRHLQRFGVVRLHFGACFRERVYQWNGGRFAHVVGPRLERQSPHGHGFALEAAEVRL